MFELIFIYTDTKRYEKYKNVLCCTPNKPPFVASSYQLIGQGQSKKHSHEPASNKVDKQQHKCRLADFVHDPHTKT